MSDSAVMTGDNAKLRMIIHELAIRLDPHPRLIDDDTVPHPWAEHQAADYLGRVTEVTMHIAAETVAEQGLAPALVVAGRLNACSQQIRQWICGIVK